MAPTWLNTASVILIPLLSKWTIAGDPFMEETVPFLGPDPNGDMLVVFNGYTPICLAAALANNAKDIKGRTVQKGDVYPGACKKTPDEVWIVHNDNGKTTLRLKANRSLCLTMRYGYPARVTPCGHLDHVRRQSIELRYRHNEFFVRLLSIYGIAENAWLRIDASNQSLEMPQAGTRMLDLWAWVSSYEKLAEPLRNMVLVFPPANNTRLEKARYRAAMIDQMISGKLYPPVNITRKACEECDLACDRCDCFPIDYDLKREKTKPIFLDLTLNTDLGSYGVSNGPRNLVASGMYAIPGEELIIELGQYNQQKAEINMYLFLQDHLTLDETDIWRRPSELTRQHTLAPGINKIRTPYGGPIILDVARRDPDSGVIKATIRDAAPMATFILDETTEESWKKEVDKDPGWFVFRGKYSAGLDLKKPYTNATFDQVRSMVMRYELMIMNSYLLNGHDFGYARNESKSIHAVPDGWYWWIRDSRKGMYAGNPARFAWYHHDRDIQLVWENMYNFWGYFHEFGHAFTPCFGYPFNGEIMANIHSIFQMAYFCGDGKMTRTCPTKEKHIYFDNALKTMRKRFATNPTYSFSEMMREGNYDAGLLFWVQIFSRHGFVAYRQMNRRFREMAQNESTNVCRVNDQRKIDAVYEMLSEVVGEDLTKHFDTYRIPLSAEARRRVSGRALPKPPVDLFNLNIPEGLPLTWNPKGPVPSYALPSYLHFEEMRGRS